MKLIRFGGLELNFLQDKHVTNGSLDVFTTRAAPHAGMPIAHHHETWDETILGLAGTSTWTIEGRDVSVGPGESIFIARGVVHSFRNETDDMATFLTILSPGVLGPEYFEETAELVNDGRATLDAVRALMLRHGLTPEGRGRSQTEATACVVESSQIL